MFETKQIVVESTATILSLMRKKTQETSVDEIKVVQETNGSKAVVLSLTPYNKVSLEVIFNYQRETTCDDYASWSSMTFINNVIAFQVDGCKQKQVIDNLTYSEGESVSRQIREWLKLPMTKHYELVSDLGDVCAYGLIPGVLDATQLEGISLETDLYYRIKQDVQYQQRLVFVDRVFPSRIKKKKYYIDVERVFSTGTQKTKYYIDEHYHRPIWLVVREIFDKSRSITRSKSPVLEQFLLLRNGVNKGEILRLDPAQNVYVPYSL